MIRKIIFISVFCFLVLSCGKKSDPEFKDKNEKIIKFKKASEY
jgi:hypothetical protein